MVRKPPSPRSAADARSAMTTCGLTRRRRRHGSRLGTVGGSEDSGISTVSSPTGTSTWRGSRVASQPAPTNTTAVHQRSGSKPNSAAIPAATPPSTPAVSKPNTDSRAFAEVSERPAGSTRGTTAARSTLCDLESTSTPRAAG